MTLTKQKPRRPTRTEQQRAGRHHRVNHHYLKPYWPYLPIVAISILGFSINNWLANMHRSVLGYATDVSSSVLLQDTNTARNAYQETALTLDSQLTQAAQAKANDMAQKDYWSHNTPDGKTPWSFITASGYSYNTAGENLAYGFSSAGSIMTAWMNSPEHRANVLDTTYENVGFGIVDVPDYQHKGSETLVVALYASPATKSAIVTASATSPLSIPPAMATTAHLPTGSTEPAAESISRSQFAFGSNSLLIIIIAASGVASCAYITLKHSLAWRKVLVRGERFITRHPLLDIVSVMIISYSVIISHTIGFIR